MQIGGWWQGGGRLYLGRSFSGCSLCQRVQATPSAGLAGAAATTPCPPPHARPLHPSPSPPDAPVARAPQPRPAGRRPQRGWPRRPPAAGHGGRHLLLWLAQPRAGSHGDEPDGDPGPVAARPSAHAAAALHPGAGDGVHGEGCVVAGSWACGFMSGWRATPGSDVQLFTVGACSALWQEGCQPRRCSLMEPGTA